MNNPNKRPATKKRHRPKGNNALTAIPSTFSTPSMIPFLDAISFRRNPVSHLFSLKTPISIDFEDAQLEGVIDMDRYGKLRKSNYADDTIFDLPLLCILYSIIENELDHDLAEGVLIRNNKVTVAKVYIPDLLKQMGYDSRINQNQIDSFVAKIKQFENVMGYLKIKGPLEMLEEVSRVLVAFGYDPGTNVLLFGSRYFETIAYYIQMQRIRNLETETGQTYFDENGMLIRGKPLLLIKPGHSHLLELSAYRPRPGDFSFELASMLCVLIDRTGSNPKSEPHIKVCKLVQNCDGFLKSLNNINRKQHKDRKLKGTFQRVKDILENHSRLKEVYRDIQIEIPEITTKNFYSAVLRFPHEGRISKACM